MSRERADRTSKMTAGKEHLYKRAQSAIGQIDQAKLKKLEANFDQLDHLEN